MTDFTDYGYEPPEDSLTAETGDIDPGSDELGDWAQADDDTSHDDEPEGDA